MTSVDKKNGRYMPRSGSITYSQNDRMHHSSKDNPCPVCDRTKDGDCSISQDRELVLCHTNAKQLAVPTANGYHFTGKLCDDGLHGPDSAAIYTKSPKQIYTRAQPFKKVKSPKEIKKAVQLSSMEVEVETDYLGMMVSEGSETLEQAQVTLAAWCKENGHSAYSASRLLDTKVKAARERQGIQGTSDEAPRLVREYRLIEQQFGDRLRLNELLKQVELDGEYFDPAKAKLEINITHSLSIKGAREDLSDSILKLAKQNSYSPVGEYLRAVHQEHGDSTDVLNGFAQRHLGTSEPIHDALLKRFLIAAVARAIAPGCKHDCALILQGPQGYGKSTFFKILASEPWFDDSLGSASDKDEKLKLHQFWMVEWAELENVFRRRDVSQVKAFMSSAIDNLRPPYGQSMERLKRASVIVGTTNQEQFLADTTGNRRFWVVPVTRPLDLAALRAERDRVWAAAVTLYQAGEQWWLTAEESREVDAMREQYESEDAWFEPISDYVDGLEMVTIQAILTSAIDMEVGRRNSGHFRRVGDVLRKLGWEKLPNAVAHNGKKQKVWKRSFPPSC
ncbi:virulence-associated E family protein [Leptolyngbya sp. BC1307]|uniref:virulence-associated E family protein n=1 Tax=Leptolyngbya sp. BC1307 TaxID=2029589 RepID=UPI000EFA9F96|nr:virulence-associated E family protein [Leptolyngbya sp. BC1307]